MRYPKLLLSLVTTLLLAAGCTTPPAVTAAASDGRFNVRDHGAKGDGTTPDTAAINATIDAAGRGGRRHGGVPRGQLPELLHPPEEPCRALSRSRCDHCRRRAAGRPEQRLRCAGADHRSGAQCRLLRGLRSLALAQQPHLGRGSHGHRHHRAGPHFRTRPEPGRRTPRLPAGGTHRAPRSRHARGQLPRGLPAAQGRARCRPPRKKTGPFTYPGRDHAAGRRGQQGHRPEELPQTSSSATSPSTTVGISASSPPACRTGPAMA